MKILFVFPHIENTWNKIYNNNKLIGFISDLFSKFGSKIISKGLNFHIPPLSILSVVSLTPKEIDVELIDERIDYFNYKTDADIIALSVNTPTAYRAFKISLELRKRNKKIKIVMGGMHPSICPDECLEYADSICVGEVEYIWKKLINDFKIGKLKNVYKQNILTDPKDFPIIDYSLLNKKYYLTTNVINVIRGCPNNCSYCAGSLITGKKRRLKPLDQVKKEIECFTGKLCYIVDDNIFYDREYLVELSTFLGKNNISWFSAAPISIGKDIELLNHLHKNGCFVLGIGLESILPENLKKFNKQYIPSQYPELIKNIKSAGIAIYGLFMFGGEYDRKETFNETCDFIIKNNIDLIQFTILTPYPGTPLYEQLNNENKILTKDWGLYDGLTNVVFKHKHLAENELINGIQHSYNRVYSKRNILKRLKFSNPNFLYMILANIGYKKAFTKKVKNI